MAKIPYSKLNLNKHRSEPMEREWGEGEEKITFTVRTYLPIEELVELVQNIVNYSVDDKGYYNPMKIHMFTTVETFFACAEIKLTEKQRENYTKLYDELTDSEIYRFIPMNIYQQVTGYVSEVIRTLYEYKNSAYGIMDSLANDYKQLGESADDIQKKLSDPDNLTLVREVLSKLG